MNKIFTKTIIGTVIGWLLFFTLYVISVNAETLYTTVNLNYRTEPSTANYKTIQGTLSIGDSVNIIQKFQKWSKINLNGQHYYVYNDYLSKIKTDKVDLGSFRLTAYCPCSSCSGNWGKRTSTGTRPIEGRTVAVDPRIIPYGTKLLINGKEYIAEDCGGAIKGNKIDIYFNSHSRAKNFGVQYSNVYKII